jgi:cap1 methyltransferase
MNEDNNPFSVRSKMDPTEQLCSVQGTIPIAELNSMLPLSYAADLVKPNLSQVSITTTTQDNLDPITVDAEKYRILQVLKNNYTHPQYESIRSIANPFENVGRSIFMNRAAIKIANIDAIYNISGHNTGLVEMQRRGRFTFCDVAAGPGGFTEYIQWRRPDAFGWGMTLTGPLDWNKDRLDLSRFGIIYGPDNTGNLYEHWKFFVDQVTRTEVAGVDLVMADGGFDIEGDTDQFAKQEFLSSRLLLCQIAVALGCLKEDGDFVCKVFDTVTSLSAELLYLLASCFETITIFKPISSRPANAERYIIAKGAKSMQFRAPYLDLLAQANASYKEGVNVSSLFDIKQLPPTFIQWLQKNNEDSVNRQIELAQRVQQLLNGEQIELPVYNLSKALLVWNLPDNPLTKRSIFRL